MKSLMLVALALGACGDDGMTVDDGGQHQSPDEDTQHCDSSVTEPVWLDAYLDETMLALAAAPRFTTIQRASARTYLAQQLTRWGWTEQRQAFPAGENVFATLPATTGAARGLIVGAHFDTVSDSPGANDNASGTAVVLAVARHLAETTCRSAPVTVVFFDLEESGLTGSRAFAQTIAVPDIAGVMTIDQVAWDDDGDHRFELEAPTSVPTLEAAWKSAAMDLGIQVSVEDTEGTDHEAFRERGFAAIGLTEEYVAGDTTPHRHTPQDTLSTVDTEYLGLAARLTIRALNVQL